MEFGTSVQFFEIIMQEVREVSYTEWLTLVKGVKEKGQNSNEFFELQNCYPHRSGDSYKQMLQCELAKLETVLIEKAIRNFERSIARSMNENDLEIAQNAICSLKKNVRGSMFFLSNGNYSEDIRINLLSELKKNLLLFQAEITRFLRKLELDNSSHFVQDLVYLCRKCNLLKIILECEKDAQLHTS